MGYINDLEQSLREKLSDLGEEEREAVVKFVKEKVWESYKNGRESATTAKTGQDTERKVRRFSRRRE